MIEIDLRASDTPIAIDFGDELSFMFNDPKPGKEKNQYCVGLIFQGSHGEEDNPAKWVYDHCNYWIYDEQKGDVDDVPVEKEDLEKVLQEHGTSLDQAMKSYVAEAFTGVAEASREIKRGFR